MNLRSAKSFLERNSAPYVARWLAPIMRRQNRAGWKRFLWNLANRNFFHHPVVVISSDLLGHRIRCRTDDFVQKHIMIFGMWEPILSKYLLSKVRNGGIFLDIGANIGYFSLLASDVFGKVIAFEPSPSIHTELASNVRLNGKSNIITYPVGVAQQRGKLPFFRSTTANLGISSFTKRSDSELEAVVPCGPLQDYLSPDEWKNVQFVKIDVEGAEPGVLASLLESHDLLPRTVEIAVETNGSADPGSVWLFNTLRDLGYHAYDLQSTYCLDQYLEHGNASPIPITTLPEAYTDCLFRRD